jgi:hypothetical protein
MVLRLETRVEEKVAQLSVVSQERVSEFPLPNFEFANAERCILNSVLRLVSLLAPKVLFQDSLNFEDGELA